MTTTDVPLPWSCGTNRPISLLRERRTRDLFLVYHFGLSLRMQWRSLVDPLGTLEMMIDIGGPLLSRRDREVIAEDPPASLAVAVPTWLMAATIWFCDLELPASEEELLGGWRNPIGGSGRGSGHRF